MAKQDSLYNTNVIESNEGISLDTDPVNQPRGTTRFALNMVDDTTDGKQGSKCNENSIYAVTSLTSGFNPLGNIYVGNNSVVVISTNPNTSKDEIGIIQKNDIYTPIINTGVLGLKITNQCDIRFRLRRGNQRVIYWVDGLAQARSVNLDKLQNYYSVAYKNYLILGGDPNLYTGEKWDANSFNLVKSYSTIPAFGTLSILEDGNIEAGSYNFSIQYVDEDLNPTAWITTSNTVNIYNDTVNNVYANIRGSRYVQNDSQNFPRTNKSITLQVSNLDQSFPFFRVAIIRAAGGTGQPEKVLASDLFPTSSSSFKYSGNDGELAEMAISDILVDNEVIFAPKHLDQLENRLIIANGQGKGVNWCDLQTYASRISSDVVYKQVILNSENSNPNVKNGNSTYTVRGNMPGEVYSYGIVWIFDDMTLAPACHIPGKSNDSREISSMQVYELDTNYLSIHNCNIGDNYWGEDHLGNTLVGKPIRHHRFPFRSQVNKPLVTSTGGSTDITKYRLRLTITLNPSWTPGPIAYPTTGGEPDVIDYTFNYQVHGAGSTASFSGELVDTDMGVQFVVYDDTVQLDFISGSNYQTIDPSCQLYTFNPGTNNRFIVTEDYESYISSTTYNSDVAEIFGIQFSNIQRPRPDIIGFYIVRNERLTTDRLIVDTAIIGPNTTFTQSGDDVYTSFGLIMPKQYYTASNCGRTGNSGKTLTYSNSSLWFFNPEFQYFGNKFNYDSIQVEGTYTETSINMPTISDVDGSTCNSGGSKGVYINDVQAGTSYNPSVNTAKNKDDDGFDLIIGYRNTNIVFGINNTSIVLPAKENILYLSAASSLNQNVNTYYNVSVDNKIGMYLSSGTYDPNALTNVSGKNALYYGAMIKNSTTAYSNFLTRTYYKEHNNPILFGGVDIINDFEVYNGDVEISAMNLVSSIYYDIVAASRPKKSSLWKIIVGTVLIAAAAVAVATGVLAPLGVALGTAAVATLASLTISYGVSLIVSGIQFDQFKNMIDVDYTLGLKDTVTDGGVYECIREEVETEDDTIRWFADRVSNIYMESAVPYGLRSGLTADVTDFVNAPQTYDENGFRSYLIEKLTAIDRQQGSGRLYRGFATAEIYDMNLDYLRFNHEKEFIHLPVEYDCCTSDQSYPLRRWYSEQSFQEENTDNYRVFLPNNYSDMEGETGEITNMFRLGNNLYMHTRESLWQQPANLQERVTSELISFIGTGEFLAIPPRKILDDNLGSPGSLHKWATIKTPNGVFFIDEIEHKIWLLGERPRDISSIGLKSHFYSVLRSNIANQVFSKLNIEFNNSNNPANPNGTGYLSIYDKRYNRVLFTKKDYALLPSYYSILTVTNSIPTSGSNFSYCTLDGQFYDGSTLIPLANSQYFENRSFTMSYSLNNKRFPWLSWHSYLPNYYISTQNSLYSYISDNNTIWRHHQEGSFHVYYGVNYGAIIELVTTNQLEDKMLEDFTIQCNARTWQSQLNQFLDVRYAFFNKVIVYNTRQSSGILNMVVKDTQANPQYWYQQQIVNQAQTILVTRKGRNWNVNDLRDYVIDYTQPLFTKDWASIQNNYFIDKVVNTSVINYSKNWDELESFSDKYVIIRLIFDTFNDISLVLNYSIDTEQTTE